jgi:hypothetical protein
MEANAVKNLIFFHGTSTTFARMLLGRAGGMPFPRQQSIRLGKELFTLCMTHVTNFFELAELFTKANSKCWSSAPIALQNIAGDNDRSLMAYGHVYLTLNPDTAISYACRTPYGSELLMFLQDTIRVLQVAGDERVEKVIAAFPEVAAVLAVAHGPIVLEISGISIDQLATDFGDRNESKILSNIDIMLSLIGQSGVAAPAAYRVASLRAEHIRAVYPLPRDLCQEASADIFKKSDISMLRIPTADWR